MATVAGNLFAPPPAGDFAIALLALDAEIQLVSKKVKRRVKLSDFYTGFMTNVLAWDELVSEILITVPDGKTAYLKYGRRHANTPSIVTVALVIGFSGEEVTSARIAVGGAGPHPLRARSAEEYLIGKPIDGNVISRVKELVSMECEPFTDAIASEWYRRRMIPVILGRAFDQITR
jgi:CO/xanthine dehydrogenase FAD-binding subunit